MTFANQNDAFKILQIFLLIIHLLDLFIKLNTKIGLMVVTGGERLVIFVPGNAKLIFLGFAPGSRFF